MKKRLRKKKRVGEFRELAFPVAFRLDANLDEDAVDAFLDELLAAVEARNLSFIGSGHVEWYGAVSHLGRGSATAEDQAFVQQLLDQDPRVQATVIGALRDAWHGDWESDPVLPPDKK
ncbi:MAG: 50S ribosome-binding protein YggL [Longimicrobiales bacterium]